VAKLTATEQVRARWLRLRDKLRFEPTMQVVSVVVSALIALYGVQRTVYVAASTSATVLPAGVEARAAVGTPTVQVTETP
jgi:hypothetical protein